MSDTAPIRPDAETIEAAIRKQLVNEQRRDLQFDEHRTDAEVVQAHLRARAHKHPGIRSIEELLDDAVAVVQSEVLP